MSSINQDLHRLYELHTSQKYLDLMSYVNHASNRVIDLRFFKFLNIKEFN